MNKSEQLINVCEAMSDINYYLLTWYRGDLDNIVNHMNLATSKSQSKVFGEYADKYKNAELRISKLNKSDSKSYQWVDDSGKDITESGS